MNLYTHIISYHDISYSNSNNHTITYPLHTIRHTPMLLLSEIKCVLLFFECLLPHIPCVTCTSNCVTMIKIDNKEEKRCWLWWKINNGVLFLKQNQQMMGQKCYSTKIDYSPYENSPLKFPLKEIPFTTY